MKLIYLSLLSSLFITNLFGQYSISGKIMDCQTNKGVSNVFVEIQNVDRKAVSDKNGNFVFHNMPKGKYILYITKDGFKGAFASIHLTEKTSNLTLSICKDKDIEIDEVIVTATRTPKNLKNVPITVQVITSEEIRKSQATDFQNFLETEFSGINFTYDGGMPNINMMGFGGKYVLFLMNGERMAGETFDNIDYDRIDLDNIERIEIIKGASSSLYGSNALGGVINIITKEARNPIDISANYLYDTSQDHKINFSVGTRQKWGSLGVASFYKQREPYILKDTNPLRRIYNDGSVKESELSQMNVAGFTNYGVSPKLKFNVVPQKMTFELTPSYYFSERNSGTQAAEKVRDHYHNYTMGAKTDFSFTENKTLSLSGAFDQYEKSNYYRLLNEREKNYENTIWRVAAQYNQAIRNEHTFVAGGEIFSDKLLSFRFNSKGTEAMESAKSYTLFAQQDWIVSPSFTLVAGLRMDYHSFFKEHFTYRLSGMYKVKDLTFRLGYSTGFRSPTLKELYTNWFHPWGGGFQIMGNKNLKPESNNNINFSVDYNTKKWNITAMTQVSVMKDKIDNDWNSSRDTIQYTNFSGKTRIIGSELSATYRLSKSLRIKGSYSYYDIEKRKSTNRPHTFTFKAEYIPKADAKYVPNVILSGKYVSSSKLYDIDNDDRSFYIPYESYVIWRLQTSIRLPYYFTLNAGINNLFDYVTKTASFYSSISPGRTYFVGLKWSI
ncbi:TonB-dependent receptor [Capnocytophaga cynodegmi]|uniref:TonB-dependent receptor n=1 Tax=Capnocytophaga cynodegmi TaxID=28189 RepID=A0A0B7HG21_9FLAO|nr:TonB-dependent receptor [Capnocytophaga cynodegmi]CEN35975.1 TonB-dependent receptor [Capnocytophaga cynodegmi]CEN36518.1 TonB-dependent receptor [Capnocytophaga cynodegmi]